MNSSNLKRLISSLILFIFGITEILLLFRFLLKIIGASTASSFVRFWYSISNSVFAPFEGTFANIETGSIIIEFDSLLAIVVYFLFAIFSIRVVDAIFKSSINEKIIKIIDSIFKFIETILIFRLLLQLFSSGSNPFISIVSSISWIFYEPFNGILKSITIADKIFETSTFVAIIMLIIFDYVSEMLLNEVFKDLNLNFQKNLKQTTIKENEFEKAQQFETQQANTTSNQQMQNDIQNLEQKQSNQVFQANNYLQSQQGQFNYKTNSYLYPQANQVPQPNNIYTNQAIENQNQQKPINTP